MAHLYEALKGVNLDGQAVQYLLESEDIPIDFSSHTDPAPGEISTVTVDEDDLFQCGKCKKQFTSFQLFVLHKREHAQGPSTKLNDCNILLSADGSKTHSHSANNQSSASETLYCQISVGNSVTESTSEIRDPVIFTENDILSFAVDQSSNLSASMELSENSTSTRLPSIHSITKQSKMKKMEANAGANCREDITFAAEVNETENTHCGFSLPNVHSSAGADSNRTEELIHYDEGHIGSTATVLLDFSNGQTVKTCNNLLPDVEFAAIQNPGVEYVSYEVELEKHSGDQNIVIDYANDCILSETQGNANENCVRGELSQSEIQTMKVERVTLLESTISNRLVTTITDASEQLRTNGEEQQASRSMLKCNFCTKLFTKNFDLQQHVRSHTGEKPFQCVVCGRAFAQKSNAKKHMQVHKVWPKDRTTLPRRASQLAEKENNTGTAQNLTSNGAALEISLDCPILQRSYACQFCNMTFPAYTELKIHMKIHSDQKVYKCIQKQCLQTFPDLESFLEHTNSAHVSGLQYRCHVCNKRFNNLESLGVHQYSHGAHAKSSNRYLSRGLTCYKCKRKFRSHAALEHHLDTSSHYFPCSFCGKVFTWERYLRRHLTIHGPEESYSCSVCGKCFRTESYLKAHMLTHSEARPFVCQHCSATFNRKDKLARHLLIHQAIKKYKCPFNSNLGCTREFSRQDKLKRHILTHTAAKQFRCKKCNKIFLRLAQLREHEKQSCLKRMKQKCMDCGNVFSSKLLLSSHKCNNRCHDVLANEGKINASNDNVENNESEIKSKRTSLKRKRVNTKLKIYASSSETSSKAEDVHHFCNNSPEMENTMCGDNVSTIEIIVVPDSMNSVVSAEKISEDNSVYLTYPSGPEEAIITEVSKRPTNKNIILPRKKENEQNIPQLEIRENSSKSSGQ